MQSLEWLPGPEWQVYGQSGMPGRIAVDSKSLEHGCRMVYGFFSSFYALGLERGHVPVFWLLLYVHVRDREEDKEPFWGVEAEGMT